MHPILFELGPLKIYSYGFSIAIAFIVATVLLGEEAKREQIPAEKIFNLVFLIIISGISGARLFYILQNLRFYLKYPYEMLMFNRGGLSFYGGLILATVCASIFLKRQKLALLPTLDIVSPYVALSQAIGRIGCFLNGCCYGKPSDFFLGVDFPGEGILRHPTQLYASVNLLTIFVILRIVQAKTSGRVRFPGQIFILYCQLYSISRFFIEYLRGDNLPVAANLTIHQLISAAIFITSGLFWIRYAKRAS